MQIVALSSENIWNLPLIYDKISMYPAFFYRKSVSMSDCRKGNERCTYKQSIASALTHYVCSLQLMNSDPNPAGKSQP